MSDLPEVLSAGGDIVVQTTQGTGWPSVNGTTVQFGGTTSRNFQLFLQKDTQSLKLRTCYSSGVWQAWRNFTFEDNTPTRGSGSNGSYRLQTDYGYIDVGPENNDFSHFKTDRPGYHFDKTVQAAGQLKVYGASVYLDSGTSRMNALQVDGNLTVNGQMYIGSFRDASGVDMAHVITGVAGAGAPPGSYPVGTLYIEYV